MLQGKRAGIQPIFGSFGLVTQLGSVEYAMAATVQGMLDAVVTRHSGYVACVPGSTVAQTATIVDRSCAAVASVQKGSGLAVVNLYSSTAFRLQGKASVFPVSAV
jgi:hypothetical protein